MALDSFSERAVAWIGAVSVGVGVIVAILNWVTASNASRKTGEIALTQLAQEMALDMLKQVRVDEAECERRLSEIEAWKDDLIVLAYTLRDQNSVLIHFIAQNNLTLPTLSPIKWPESFHNRGNSRNA